MSRAAAVTPDQFTTFGELLKFLRRRAGLNQRELSIAVGYSESQISRLELNQRPPDEVSLAARFIPALGLDTERDWVARLLALATAARTGGGPEARAPADSPPLRHNLPIQVTRFFGRESEMAHLKERLSEQRLLTLAGSGGVGKTRLSLRAAEEVVEDFADGVWFTELAPLSDPALVAQAVAASLRLRDEPGRPVLDSLIDFLRPRQVLLVLDNCEHLLDACAQLADSLLRTCPSIKILASSREPLGIAGEAVLAVPSLPFPAAGQSLSAERLADYAAVRLFTDRARLVLADYEAAPNSPAIASICQRLDGIPLAIEMAAARVNLLTTEQLADRLDDAFRLLTGGSRTALPRQQTLRATMDWSYQLLSEPERVLLQRLSVFAGGWTLEAAESVCAGDGVQAYEVLDLLAHLAIKSLVGVVEQAGAARYAMLETIRQYAREKLHEAVETAPLRARHQDYFLSFAEANFPKLQTKELAAWSTKLVAEQDNFRQALEWSFSDLTDVEAGPRLVIAMLSNLDASQYLYPFHEQFDWCKRALALCQSRADISARLHVKLLESAASFTALDDPQTALAWSKQAVEISRGLGPEGKETLMWNLFHLAQFLLEASEMEQAVAPIAESESILQELGPVRYAPEESLRVQAYFVLLRADLANRQGRYLEAKNYAGESIRLYEQSGSRWFGKGGHIILGDACLKQGAYPEAREHFLAALTMNRELQASDDYAMVRWLALVDVRQGQLQRALEYCRESLRQADRIPDRNVIASDLGLMAVIRAQQGQAIRAARLAGASAALHARQRLKPWVDSSLDTLLPDWREGPDQAAIVQAFEAGQAMPTEQMVAYALED